MLEYVCVIGLVLGVVYVGCQVIATRVACRTCKFTCGVMKKQMEAIEKEDY